MAKRLQLCTLLVFAFCSCNGQKTAEVPKGDARPGTKAIITSHGPASTTTRSITRDRNGNIWTASWEGVFRFDGTSFVNVTSTVSPARFFSVMEDKKGNFWFCSIGSGVYYYDGKSIQNFTTSDGLASNSVVCSYEDKAGNIWFGTESGVSFYNGKSFRNLTTEDGLTSNNINTIFQDNTGKIWFGTRGDACIYYGKTFKVVTHAGKHFTNVWSFVEDKNGNIFLGSAEGLWRSNGRTFVQLAPGFVLHIYEDRKGNIWTSGLSDTSKGWSLRRYGKQSLSTPEPRGTEIYSKDGGIFKIIDDDDGNIWFCSGRIYRIDGNTI